MPELFSRTQYIFNEAKTIMDFKWGERANTTAAACVYIISREKNKSLPLIDLAVSPFLSESSFCSKITVLTYSHRIDSTLHQLTTIP